MVQMNPTVGDLDGNVRRITAWLKEAKKAKADLVAFPELAITGYPPEDLLLKPRFIADNRRALQEIVRHCRGLAAVVGYVSQSDGLDLNRLARRWCRQARMSSTMRRRSSQIKNSSRPIANGTCRITEYSTRTAISFQAAGCRSFVYAARWLGSIFAKMSGCPMARPVTRLQQAPKSS